MLDEAQRKATVLEYFQRVNAGDVEKILEMWAPDGIIEDPVGQKRYSGTDELREFFAVVCAVQTQIVSGTVCAAQDDRQAAAPITATLVNPQDPTGGRLKINCVDVFAMNPDGTLAGLQVFWGLTDLTPA